MIPDIPLIVVSLPGRTVAEVRLQAAAARDAGADLAEVRLDRWSVSDRAHAPDLFPAPLPLIATLRSRTEGGEGPDGLRERGAQLEALGRLPFHWIDLEEERDGPIVERLPAATALGRILSTHLPEGTPTIELARRLRQLTPPGSIRKVVVPATVGTLLREILPHLPSVGESSSVLLTTGPSGALLRAWSRRFHFPLVFARLPETALGVGAPPVEASQIPVDRLRQFFAGGGDARLFGVAGHPVAHSLSPSLHSRWMRVGRHPGLYVPLDITSESEFVESLDPLAVGGFLGLNVTHPWKSAALEAATRVGPGAQLCGVANCLTFRDDEVEAENTDLIAVLRRLDEYRRGGAWDGTELVVIGAGGAGAATLAAARELGVPAAVFARDDRRAVAVAERFGAKVMRRPEARPFSLVVHATAVGRGEGNPLDAPLAELVGPKTQVLDWVYAPDDPSVRAITETAGGRYEDGWRLLVYQAAASFGIWWGTVPSPEELGATIAEGPCAG